MGPTTPQVDQMDSYGLMTTSDQPHSNPTIRFCPSWGEVKAKEESPHGNKVTLQTFEVPDFFSLGFFRGKK